MRPMRAWPYGLRRIAACSTPGGSMSSTKQPMPCSRRGSSFLRTGGMHPFGGEAHRLDDVLVARATTQVAAQRLADLFVGRPHVIAQQGEGADQHAGSAEAALQAVGVPERLLDRVQVCLVLGQAL